MPNADPETLSSIDAPTVDLPCVVLPSVDDQRHSVLAVVTKQTFDIAKSGKLVPAEKPAVIQQADQFFDEGDPETCSVQFESDLAPFKTVTDVVVLGSAHAPDEKPLRQLDVAVDVGTKRKLIRVFGDRFCRYRDGESPEFSAPEPFTVMPIRYENAYGGVDRVSEPGLEFSYPRNHVGKGFVCKNIPEAIEGLALPNLEDPNDLLTPQRLCLESLTSWNEQPLPQGFGWFQKTWYPRCSFVGAVPGFVDPDEVMREETLGLVPKGQIALARQFKLPSFDIRFNSGASVGLAFAPFRGDEVLTIHHMTPDRMLQVQLPGQPPQVTLNLGKGVQQLDPVLHTVCVRVEDRQVDLVWRGSLSNPDRKWLTKLQNLEAFAR
ncbi:DUF2169 domain-containing protein [Rhodopirellula sp. MGV]|uniref:DUF2169 family type VI secretion system accessory protein n=1 Tax=Rhodopirellula sp. MGV TaxID=2023130 RepID=UPI000B964B50|nr:DUF2169 domain-containing protein [Rhodopirellula sp. MGV]OYP35463.1 hypothetical protein CGZ80_11515 [Rhodopirellula sp. MGV]PNY33904.1 DUF2169 domain-containing protein [Rhodopirellula baltica]